MLLSEVTSDRNPEMRQTCPFCGDSYPDNVAHACPGFAALLLRDRNRHAIRKVDRYRSYLPAERKFYRILWTGQQYITAIFDTEGGARFYENLVPFSIAGRGSFRVKREHHHRQTSAWQGFEVRDGRMRFSDGRPVYPVAVYER